MSYLFVFRSYPDVDHMAPLAWKLLEEGDEVHAVISPGYDPRQDYRLRYLRRYERFHLHEVWPHGGHLAAVRGWLRSTLPWAFLFLVRRPGVRMLAVEWGHGPVDPYQRPLSARGLIALLKDLAVSIKNATLRVPTQVRTNFVVAAWLLRRPTVCLPHGLNIKLDAITTDNAAASLKNGPYPWTDRNRFAAYVLNTEHHRRWHLDYAMGDPDVLQTWGSLRWAPEWFGLNRRIAPRFEWPEEEAARLKVVFMVPKWQKRVDAAAVIDLVKSLQAVEGISLAIKGHPRPEDGSADPLRSDPEIDWGRIHDATGADSVSLIAASEVIIDVGSSIGIEVVMQGKVLLNPAYLHGITTLFDEIPGSCVVAASADEVVTYLGEHTAGRGHQVPKQAIDELMRRTVYGSRPEPFDVLGLYARRVRLLASPSVESPVRVTRKVPVP